MAIIAYKLSMPSNNSWNGKWSGEDNVYARTKSTRSQTFLKKVTEASPYYYNFGDGWTACVHAVEVDASEARKLRKKSKGFCGYDWMISSIEMHGHIQA